MKVEQLLQTESFGPRLDALKPTDGKDNAFADQLDALVQQVEHNQLDAREQSVKAAAGEGNLHEVALALEKADISIRLLSKGRDKIVSAYQEIMRMQV